jgi:hypothetical protein
MVDGPKTPRLSCLVCEYLRAFFSNFSDRGQEEQRVERGLPARILVGHKDGIQFQRIGALGLTKNRPTSIGSFPAGRR